jgi:ABC-type branched-subunit amino acid transport system ATPase component
VTKSFDGRTVVDVDDLTLGNHPIEGLIGPNGAGKTTLMRLIMHSIALDTGTVSLSDPASLNGNVVLSQTPQHRIAGLGVAKTNQVIQDFPNLTIWDSLLLAVAEAKSERPGKIYSERRVLDEHGDEIQQYLDYFNFENPTGFANSAGEKKLLDTIRCLLLNPKVLLLDEPTAGLPEDLTEQLMELIRQKAARGMSVIVVEHDLTVIWGLSDLVHFMAEGSVILQGDPASIREHETVIEEYLGSGHVGG